MKTKFSALLIMTAAFSVVLFVAGCGKSNSKAGAAAKYFCPMHPTYTSDRPGDCPICNMKLVPIKSSAPMAEHTAHEDGGPTNAPHVSGRIPVQISADKQQLIGLRTSPVERRELSQTIRAIGIIQHDETRLFKITPRFGGFLSKLFVNSTGQLVNKGDPLFSVYSPELFATERDYLLAYEQFQKAKDLPELQKTTRRLLDGARKRLELWQISEEEIRAIENGGEPRDEIVFRSPFSGHVISKTAVQGKSFMPGETLYEIADLSHLWVRAGIYEAELPNVRVGQKARVILPYLGNKSFESKVTFIYPHIDPQTRRAEVRLELENPIHELRPDMWADVEIEVSLGSALTVPDSAVIDTGTRFVAFVKKEENQLEPRELKIGAKTDEYYQVLDGLKVGENVVTRALFLVDSESQLKAAISGMGAAGAHQH
jgi:Cu(I)/Ag(I) efflux system membrane fusion protein